MNEFIVKQLKARGMRGTPELLFYFINILHVLMNKSTKLKDAGAELLAAAPAGKRFCIFDVALH